MKIKEKLVCYTSHCESPDKEPQTERHLKCELFDEKPADSDSNDNRWCSMSSCVHGLLAAENLQTNIDQLDQYLTHKLNNSEI
jgi:hypothetical protein